MLVEQNSQFHTIKKFFGGERGGKGHKNTWMEIGDGKQVLRIYSLTNKDLKKYAQMLARYHITAVWSIFDIKFNIYSGIFGLFVISSIDTLHLLMWACNGPLLANKKKEFYENLTWETLEQTKSAKNYQFPHVQARPLMHTSKS